LTDRSAQDLPIFVDRAVPARSIFCRRRRVLAAFLLGAPLAAMAWLIVQPGGRGAAAHGPAAEVASTFFTNMGGFSRSASDGGARAALDAPSERKHKQANASLSLTSSRSVCVRLCDGFFFPVAPVSGRTDLADHEAACESNCPDAPTALYIEPSGSDKIEDAVSTSGVPYTALPVALRSRTALDNTCACHRATTRGYGYALLHDFTLRRGDAVMTPTGFMVFQGRKRLPFVRRDFLALSQAPMANDNRAALLAMERASAMDVRGDKSRSAALLPEKSIRQ
jgi:hypothetical protein